MEPKKNAKRGRPRRPEVFGPVKPTKKEASKLSLSYVATLTVDFTWAKPTTGERTRQNTAYNRLVVALSQIGWSHLETSAFALRDVQKLQNVWTAIELVMRQSHELAPISALSFHIQGSGFWPGVQESQEKFFPNAKDDILRGMPLPWQRAENMGTFQH